MSVPECLGCRVVTQSQSVPGGVLWRREGLVLHAVAAPSPLQGWLVITSERHVRGLYDLNAQELQALGPLMGAVMNAQREALGAEHVYAFAIGDVLRHFHLHLVPRFADTPERLRGRGCFEGRPEDMRPEPELAHAAGQVAQALRK